MTEPIINQQELIEVVPFEVPLLFGSIPISWREHPVPVIAGFSQEVFSNQTYIGSVSSSSSQIIYARRGDLIYRVSLAPRPESCKGVVMTTDRYQRTYEVHFDVVVRDAKRCVEQYRNGLNGADLINFAVHIIRNATVHYLQQYTHDEIGPSGLKIDAYNTILKNEYGLGFTNLRWNAPADPRRISEKKVQQEIEQRRREIETQIHELERQAYLRKAELHINADVKNEEERIKREQEREQKQYDRNEEVKKNSHLHQEKMKVRLNEARIKLLNKAVDDLIRINGERMQDAFDSNASAIRVLEDSLMLIGVFEGPADQEINDQVINAFPSELDNPTWSRAEGDSLATEEVKKDISEI